MPPLRSLGLTRGDQRHGGAGFLPAARVRAAGEARTLTPLEGEARPHSKETALARGERRYTRLIASPKRWQQIASAKQGPCRVTGAPPPNQLHHVVARIHGGADTEANIVPLSAAGHDRVTRRDPGACEALLASLSDAEYSYMVERGGESYAERAYGLRYSRG